MNTLKPFISASIPLYCVDLDQLFPKKIQADRARAILQLMFIQYHIYMVNNPKYAPYLDRKKRYCFLESKKLQLIGKATYKQILVTLLSSQIIEVRKHPTTNTESYQPGRAKEYRIHPNLTRQAKIAGGRSYRIEKIETPAVIGAIKKIFDKNYINQLKKVSAINPLFRKIMEFTDALELDLECIEQDIRSGKLIDPKETYFSISETYSVRFNRHVKYSALGKRLYHHLCSLPSDLRHYLVHPDGEPLVELDIVNSHPWVLGSCLMHADLFIDFVPEFRPILNVIQGYSSCNDVIRFHSITSQGKLIPNWLFVTGVIKNLDDPYTKEQKDAAKEQLFHNIFYGSPDNHFEKGSVEHEQRFRTELLFKSEYPNVHKVLVELKRTKVEVLPFIRNTPRSNGKKGLMRSTPSVMLESMESHLIYQILAPLIQDAGIQFTTIHDSFIMSLNDKNMAVEIVEHAFRKLGIKCAKLRITELHETDI